MRDTARQFTESEQAFRDTVRELAARRFAAGYHERAMSTDFPRDVLLEVGKAALTGMLVPVDLGGEGATPTTLGIACEEVAYADAAAAYLVFAANLASDLIARSAPGDLAAEWLPPILAGERVVALALTEPGAGSDAAAVSTRATRTPDGWRLSGEKTSVTLAPHADAALVFARTGDGRADISCFLVPLDQPGVTRQTFRDPGFRPLGRGGIALDDVEVPDGALVGEIGKGLNLALHEFDLTRTLIALMVIGIATRARDLTIDYVRERTTFGRPLSTNQGVSFPIAEHSTYLEAARALAYRTLALREAGLPHSAEAAMLKWWAPEIAFNAIKDFIVLHGHVGWSDEMPLQSMLRDVSAYLIGDGTPQIQKLVIARKLIGRDFVG